MSIRFGTNSRGERIDVERFGLALVALERSLGPREHRLVVAGDDRRDEPLVVLQLLDDQGFVPAIVTSDDEAVLAWAERTFERYKREAEPLDVDAFTA